MDKLKETDILDQVQELEIKKGEITKKIIMFNNEVGTHIHKNKNSKYIKIIYDDTKN
jgi:hypothetical protein